MLLDFFPVTATVCTGFVHQNGCSSCLQRRGYGHPRGQVETYRRDRPGPVCLCRKTLLVTGNEAGRPDL